jgi:hypothetical protein
MKKLGTDYFSSTLELFKRYKEKIKKENPENYPSRWIHEILKRLQQMSFSCNKVSEYEEKIMSLVQSKDFDFKLCMNEYNQLMFEAEYYVETFYFIAFRVREILKKKNDHKYLFPILNTFESKDVCNVRNHLIEHPEKHGGVLCQCFGVGSDVGPVLKSAYSENDRPDSMDKGMWLNISEFRTNLEKVLLKALNT